MQYVYRAGVCVYEGGGGDVCMQYVYRAGVCVCMRGGGMFVCSMYTGPGSVCV